MREANLHWEHSTRSRNLPFVHNGEGKPFGQGSIDGAEGSPRIDEGRVRCPRDLWPLTGLEIRIKPQLDEQNSAKFDETLRSGPNDDFGH